MYIKLLVLIGVDLHFPLISGIYKLNLIKASWHTFQLSPCFISFIIVIHFTLTTKICKKNWIEKCHGSFEPVMFHSLRNAVMCLWTWVGYNSALIAQTLAQLHIFRTKNLENKTQKNPNISNFNFRIRWSNLISFAAGTPPLQMLPKKPKKIQQCLQSFLEFILKQYPEDCQLICQRPERTL